MNEFARTAMAYWRDHRPAAFAEIPHPEAFFADLGEQIATQVQAMVQAMTTTAPSTPPTVTSSQNSSAAAGQGYLARVGELNAIRNQAVEAVMHELVYGPFPPEAEASTQEEEEIDGVLWEPFPLRLPPTNPEDEAEYLEYLDQFENQARANTIGENKTR